MTLRSAHGDTNVIYGCSLCSATFPALNGASSHHFHCQRKHVQGRTSPLHPASCPASSGPGTAQDPGPLPSSLPTFQCTICGRLFSSKIGRSLHMKASHRADYDALHEPLVQYRYWTEEEVAIMARKEASMSPQVKNINQALHRLLPSRPLVAIKSKRREQKYKDLVQSLPGPRSAVVLPVPTPAQANSTPTHPPRQTPPASPIPAGPARLPRARTPSPIRRAIVWASPPWCSRPSLAPTATPDRNTKVQWASPPVWGNLPPCESSPDRDPGVPDFDASFEFPSEILEFGELLDESLIESLWPFDPEASPAPNSEPMPPPTASSTPGVTRGRSQETHLTHPSPSPQLHRSLSPTSDGRAAHRPSSDAVHTSRHPLSADCPGTPPAVGNTPSRLPPGAGPQE